MGRSLRRSKRYRPKLTKKKPRQPQTRAKTPISLQNNEAVLATKLGQTEWDSLKKTYPANYAQTGLVDDPNRAVGVRFVQGVKPLVRISTICGINRSYKQIQCFLQFDPSEEVEETEEQDDGGSIYRYVIVIVSRVVLNNNIPQKKKKQTCVCFSTRSDWAPRHHHPS